MADGADELEKQAQEMAEKALPASLPEAARKAKLPAVKQKILERLKAQKVEQATKPLAKQGAAPPAPTAGVQVPGHIPPPPQPPAPPPPPSDVGVAIVRLDGVEVCGDEPWFADAVIRRRLRESVADAHKEQKILVGLPSDEVVRICPEDGRVPFAGAVLRLGGAHLGGYGESDVAYAYRQLSRALHPDKNPDLGEKAQAAFHRLSEASEELRQGLQEQRHALKLIVGVMGGTATETMLERPQEALFAEASRLLCAVCGIVTEGEVSSVAQGRAHVKFERSSRMFYSCHMQTLMAEWFEKTHLLDLYASVPIRTAYDCAPKCFRAQFLCLLNRAAMAEAKRFNDCVRGSWPKIMQTFPEMSLWRELRQAILARVWDSSGEPVEAPPEEVPTEQGKRSRSKSRRRSRSRSRRRHRDDKKSRRSSHDEEVDDGRRHRDDTNWYERNPIRSRGRGSMAERERKRDLAWEARWTTSDEDGQRPAQAEESAELPPMRDAREVIAVHPTTGWRACKWARKWRSAMAAILPSGFDAAIPLTDTEVRKLGLLLWKDIVRWVQETEANRFLGLFRADHQTSKTFGWDGKEMSTSRGLEPLEPGATPPEWSFVPVTDLFLVVGEGLVGVTTEGIFAEKAKGQKRTSLRDCYKPKMLTDQNGAPDASGPSKPEDMGA
ncbi:unnamed protein product [Symbiodinium natans]|uniref:J domain-containing protein n=1 Tax=Symbiodinium natans TaxID=878477 RepID=A0A812IBJ2_9DINO|nr:unnamed protein product [Symbiodinium natans]